MISSIFIFLFLGVSLSIHDEETYRAAVVSLSDRKFVDTYGEYIYQAKEQGAEIVIFPELSVFMIPENVTLGETPHDDPDNYVTKPIQYRLSGAAQEHEIYVALSVFEHGESCNISQKDECLFGWYMYNTEIVFDPTGKIVLKYRKAHDFLPILDDIIHNGPGIPRYYTSDYDVTYGAVVCFDILFEEPQMSLLYEYNVQQMIFSLDWHDVIPLTAISLAQGWSRHFQSTILSANNQKKKQGFESTGSGIFRSGVPLAYTISTSDELLVTDVPKTNDFSKKKILASSTTTRLKDNFKPDNETYLFLATPGYELQNKILEIDDVKCTFSLKVSDESGGGNPEWFQLVSIALVFGEIHFETCFLQNCGTEREDCKIADKDANKYTSTVFDTLVIVTQYQYVDDLFMELPLLGGNGKDLIEEGQFDFDEDVDTFTITSTDSLYQPILFAGYVGVCKDYGR